MSGSSKSVDWTDNRLLSELSKDGRLPYPELGRRAGISESEAQRRVERMVSDGTISRFTIEQGERGASAVVLVSVESGRDTARISEELARMDGAETVYEITGQYDILVIMGADTIPAINDGIDGLRRTPGVADTNTVIILRKVG
jgi:DNA-binding Lrp family transcriptional regulator